MEWPIKSLDSYIEALFYWNPKQFPIKYFHGIPPSDVSPGRRRKEVRSPFLSEEMVLVGYTILQRALK